ncbi:MAG TPA: 30S ribosomal protein S6 [Campylobacterales bacterium]|nr:30S ribosomal protein S6 [Campylobacterales bacterium]
MKHYELLFVVKATLTEEEVKGRLDFFKEVLTKNGAEITTVDEMGVRKLAYEIEKAQRGYYFVIYFTGEPAGLEEVLRNLRLDETILRFLNLKFESKKEIAQWDKLVANIGKKSAAKAAAKVAVAAATEAKAKAAAEAPKVEEVKTEPATEAPKAD